MFASDSFDRPLTRLAWSYRAQAQGRGWITVKNYVWLLVALAVAFGVRVYRLDAQSLWNDEGTALALARLSLPAIASGAAHDIHPPLYYFLLHFWRELAGDSEFAARCLSVMAGVLLVAVTFRIAREFFDEEVAVSAAFLSALSAFQVYYAQEARMYIFSALFSALSVWALARMSSSPPVAGERGWGGGWLAYTLFTTAALYTHYFAFTLVLFENLAFGAWLLLAWRARRISQVGAPAAALRTGLSYWVAAQIVIALAFLPWLLFAGHQLTTWPAIGEPMSPLDLGARVLSAFVLGIDAPLDIQPVIVAVYALFGVGGLLPSRDLFKQSAWGIIVAALWTLAPVAALYVVSLSRPAYNPKFLLLATPGLIILTARGVAVLYPGLFLRGRAPYHAALHYRGAKRTLVQLGGAVKFFVAATLAAGLVLALQGVYDDPRLQRDDYRGVVRYINALATKDDAVLVDAPGQLDVVRYYYRGAAEIVTLPLGRPLALEPTRIALDDLIAQHRNLYAIFWATEQADPQNVVETRLAARAFQASDEWHGNLRLAQYALPNAFKTDQVHARHVQFGDQVQLEQFTLFGADTVQAAQIAPFEFSWRALERPTVNYKIFVHLLAANGQIVSQRDVAAFNGLRLNDQMVIDRVGLSIPAGTPPGDYRVIMGLYRADDGARLIVTAGIAELGRDYLALGTVHVEKALAPRDALFLTRAVDLDLGAVKLLGYNLPRATLKPGAMLTFALYWQARATSNANLDAVVQLLNQSGRGMAQARAFELYPTSRWEAGEIVREVYTFALAPDAPPGEYRLVVADAARSQEFARVVVR